MSYPRARQRLATVIAQCAARAKPSPSIVAKVLADG
jgi:hypothetical protein